MQFERKNEYTVNDLLAIMEILRSPEGCPWDREQTHESIRNNLIEETYEAVEAIDTKDSSLLCEELGDVLLQVVFHAQLEKEAGGFDFSDVVNGVAQKMVERHPHVFGNVTVKDSGEVLKNWDAIKERTKGRKTTADVLAGVSPALPALMRSQKLSKKAAKASGTPLAESKLLDRLAEAAKQIAALPGSAGDDVKLQKIGGLLFFAAALSETLGVEAEQALAQYCDGFVRSYQNENK